MYIEIFLEKWDEDDSAELLEDDNSQLMKPTCPLSSTLSSAYFKCKTKTLRKPAVLSGEEVVEPKK